MILKEEENVKNKEELLSSDENTGRYQAMCKRKAQSAIEKNRVKRRRSGAGAPEKIDKECEKFIAKAIESKATYHGRRQDAVMYTNRRVKGRDLDIANYRLEPVKTTKCTKSAE